MTIDYVIIDDKKYGILKETTYNEATYVFLANLNDPTDQLIKKYYESNKEELLPLDSDEEFNYILEETCEWKTDYIIWIFKH